MNNFKVTFNHSALLVFILIKAIVMPISMGTCAERNLTTITWKHAVNSQDLLNEALASNADAIEADVVMGTLVDVKAPKSVATELKDEKGIANKALIPIMAHPPANESDLSLEQFLGAVKKYNTDNKNKTKMVKLDFKSTEAITESVNVLKKEWNDVYMNFPVWINADIIEGPGARGKPLSVDAKQFFDSAKTLPNATLSIGWTTNWIKNTTESYTHDDAHAMMKLIQDNQINGTGHSITFPIRAAFAVNSLDAMKHLHSDVSKQNEATFTIWSADADEVDAKQLENFIRSLGVDKVYLDVPKKLQDNINLGNGSSTLVNFGILNVIALAIALFFRNGLH